MTYHLTHWLQRLESFYESQYEAIAYLVSQQEPQTLLYLSYAIAGCSIIAFPLSLVTMLHLHRKNTRSQRFTKSLRFGHYISCVLLYNTLWITCAYGYCAYILREHGALIHARDMLTATALYLLMMIIYIAMIKRMKVAWLFFTIAGGPLFWLIFGIYCYIKWSALRWWAYTGRSDNTSALVTNE